MKRYTLVLFLAFGFIIAQNSLPRVALSSATAVVVDAEGNSYITGRTKADLASKNLGESDAFLAKYDSEGNQLWLQQFGTELADAGVSLSIDRDAFILATINSQGDLANTGRNTEQWRSYFARFTQQGELLALSQGGDFTGGRFILNTEDNIIASVSFPYEALDKGGAVINLKPNNDLNWISFLSDELLKRNANSVAVDALGNLYFMGTQRPFANIKHPSEIIGVIGKFDAEGNLLWSQKVNEPLHAGAVDPLGISYVTGMTWFTMGDKDYPDPENTSGSSDAFLASFDADGNQRWLKQFGARDGYNGKSVTVDSQGNAIVVGSGGGDLGGERIGASDVFVVKYDAEGNQLWAQRFGSEESDSALAVTVDLQDFIYVTGYLTETSQDTYDNDGFSNNAGRHVFLVKYDSEGNQLWMQTISPK